MTQLRRSDFSKLPPLRLASDEGEIEVSDFPTIAEAYATACADGQENVCSWIRLAAKRHLKMLKMAKKKGNEFVYSPAHVVDYCMFIEKLKHAESGLWTFSHPIGEDGKPDPYIIMEPWQIWVESALQGFRSRRTGERWIDTSIELVPRKNAKALALDTPIATPSGWTTMGDVRVGDVVFSADGSMTRVIGESDIFKGHDCYRVRFSNGDSIVADAGHRWLTEARVDRVGAGVGQGRAKAKKGETLTTRVRTTEEIFKTQTYGARRDRNHSIRLVAPIAGAETKLPIDPYVLGVWLGDGTTLATAITVGNADLEEMAANLSGRGFEVDLRKKTWNQGSRELVLRTGADFAQKKAGSTARPTAKKAFRDAGVLGNKHIPSIYLRSSISQRIELLQGLMDTDGTISRDGVGLSYCTTTPALKDGFCELLSTLGIKFSCKEKPSVCNGRPVAKGHWKIQFSCRAEYIPAFKLERKLTRMQRGAVDGRCRTVQIVGVEKVSSVPTKCITVDHPSHLFLAGKTMLPTHNSERIAGAALYDLCCSGQVGPQIVIAAGGGKGQANRVFGPVTNFINADQDLIDQFQINVTAESITTPTSGKFGGIFKLSAQGQRLDGLNPLLAVFEEGHSGSTEVYKVVDSAFGARPGAQRRMITTAGYNPEGPGYELQKSAELMLLSPAKYENYRFFAALYTLDKSDYVNPDTNAIDFDKLFSSERLVEKANPMYRVSLDPEKVMQRVKDARRNPRERGEQARTRFNIWTGAGVSLIDETSWAALVKPKMSLYDFIGKKCWIGVDLASTLDMCAIALLFEMPEDQLAIFSQHFIPELSALLTETDLVDQLSVWSDPSVWDGDPPLMRTEGAEADHGRILETLQMFCEMFDVQVIALDPFQANWLQRSLIELSLPAMVYPNTAGNMTPPVDDFLGKIASNKLHHDGNPVLAWNARNVHGDKRGNGLILPRKDKQNSIRKIDGFVAACFANGVRMNGQGAKTPAPDGKPTKGWGAYAGQIIGAD